MLVTRYSSLVTQPDANLCEPRRGLTRPTFLQRQRRDIFVENRPHKITSSGAATSSEYAAPERSFVKSGFAGYKDFAPTALGLGFLTILFRVFAQSQW